VKDGEDSQILQAAMSLWAIVGEHHASAVVQGMMRRSLAVPSYERIARILGRIPSHFHLFAFRLWCVMVCTIQFVQPKI